MRKTVLNANQCIDSHSLEKSKACKFQRLVAMHCTGVLHSSCNMSLQHFESIHNGIQAKAQYYKDKI
jgi:hypothetical protein